MSSERLIEKFVVTVRFGPGLFRFLLSMIVVAHHSTPLRLGSWAVYVFFILSGYWIARMWSGKYANTRQPLVTFLVSRWWRLAPVFITCVALALAIAAIRIFDAVSPPVPEDMILWSFRQLPIIASSWAGRLMPPTWSLDVEMQFYVGVAVLLWGLSLFKLGAKVRLWIAAVTPGIGLLGSCLFTLRGGVHEMLTVFPWLGLFGIGMALWYWRFAPSPRFAIGGVCMTILLGVCILAIPESRGAVWRRGVEGAYEMAGGWDWVSLALLGGAVTMTPFVAWNVNQPSSMFDRLLGNWAYPLYLFHWLPRDWYYSVTDVNTPAGVRAALFVVNISAALLGSFLIQTFIDRPMNRLRTGWVERRARREASGPEILKPRRENIRCEAITR